jgi:MarR family transcriptional regulator, lower aerobic nicotinate degradation pathway regulator
MAMEPAELLALVGRLNRQGLVRPQPSPQDHRLIMLDLSPEARATMGEIKAAAETAATATLAPLAAHDAKMLSSLLAKLTSA